MARPDGLDREDTILFSESQSRFLVEVAPEHRAAFEARFTAATSCSVGHTVAEDHLRIHAVDGTVVVDEKLEDLREAHQAPLRW